MLRPHGTSAPSEHQPGSPAGRLRADQLVKGKEHLGHSSIQQLQVIVETNQQPQPVKEDKGMLVEAEGGGHNQDSPLQLEPRGHNHSSC